MRSDRRFGLVGLLLLLGCAGALAQPATRITTQEYHDDSQRWSLSQLKRVTVNGVETQRISFNAQALPEHRHAFGERVSTTSYYADGSVATVADGNGQLTRYEDYQRGVPRRVVLADGSQQLATVDAHGQVSSFTDEAGATTCYAYDAMGRLARITPPAEASAHRCAQDAWWIENFQFRAVGANEARPPGIAAGQWQRRREAGSRRELTWFDALWRPVLTHVYDQDDPAGTLRAQSWVYDGQGRVAFASYPSNQAAPPAVGTWTQYDAIHRVTTVQQDSELGRLSTRTLYGPGLQTRVTNPRGQLTTTFYAALGQPHYDWPLLTQLPEGVVTEVVRDGFGQPLRLTRRGASGSPRVDRYAVYDSQQRLCKTVEPETGTSIHAYDAVGNLLGSASGLKTLASTHSCDREAAKASGQWVARRYDTRHRLTHLQFPDGQGDQSWTYTVTGLPASVTAINQGGAQVRTSYAYNRLGLLTQENSSQPGWYDWKLTYAYDGHGQLRMQGYPTGLMITYQLNALGQATRVTDNFGQVYAHAIGYHPNGALKQFAYGNGIVHSTQQNVRQLPARIIDANVADFSYGYDANANPLSIRAVAPVPRSYSGNRDMAYDGLDRLIYAHLEYQQIDRWQYDALDRLAHHDHFNGAVNTRHTYYYDAHNQLGNVLNAGTGASIAGLRWDAQGNLQQRNAQRYVFDTGNRLREVVGKAWYRYDGLGRRVLSAQPDGIGVYQYSRAGQLLYYEQSGQGNYELIYLTGRLLASRNKAGISYQHTDALGSPIAETSIAGIITARTDYGPFGQLLRAPPYSRIGYTGHLHDAATGLLHMQQRYYDPTLHTFLSVDPVGAFDTPDPRLFNRYAYAANNPYRYRDPDGRIIDTIADVGFIAYDIYTLAVEPSWSNLGALTADVAGAAIPGVTGLGIAVRAASHGTDVGRIAGKVASQGDEVSRTVRLSRANHGEAAEHAADAIASGKPSVLTIERTGASANRRAATGGMAKVPGKQLDEYPPAMFKEGGKGASVRAINARDNASAGACIGNACRGLLDGDRVKIEVGD